MYFIYSSLFFLIHFVCIWLSGLLFFLPSVWMSILFLYFFVDFLSIWFLNCFLPLYKNEMSVSVIYFSIFCLICKHMNDWCLFFSHTLFVNVYFIYFFLLYVSIWMSAILFFIIPKQEIKFKVDIALYCFHFYLKLTFQNQSISNNYY